MGRTILFSPVGGTDPISNSNCQDGALIHTCRVYKPDKIYLYMSKWVLDREAEDNRYTYCLKKLYEKLDKTLDYEIIERPELNEVQDFDFFYDDFKTEIFRIVSTMSSDDKLILNTSSGTPAMKSTLVVLATVGDVDGSLVQVTTPENNINTHIHEGYDVKSLWNLNPDNEDDFVNRCQIIECPSLYQIKNEELLKRLIQSYDYYAALEIAKTLPEKYTYSYIHLIEYAYHRITLNKEKRIDWEYELNDLGFVPEMDEDSRDLVEYALSVFIKARIKNYADFIRSITPLLVSLMVEVVRNLTGVYAYDYCYKESNGGLKWSRAKLEKNKTTSEWIRIWESENGFDKKFKDDYISSQSLLYIIKNCGNRTVAAISGSLRNVEFSVRNVAAHQIKAISNESIRIATGKTSGEIVRAFKDLFKYSGIKLPDNVWKSYEEMNDYIINQISSSHV